MERRVLEILNGTVIFFATIDPEQKIYPPLTYLVEFIALDVLLHNKLKIDNSENHGTILAQF